MHPHTSLIEMVQELAVIANENQPAVVTLAKLQDRLGRFSGWQVGRIVLRSGIAIEDQISIPWSNPEAADRSLALAGWDAGYIHHRAAAGEPVIVADIRTDAELSPYFAGLPADLRGYLAYPIRPETVFIGVIEFFAAEPLNPTSEALGLTSFGATLLGLVMTRGRAQERLRKSESRFRAIFDQSFQFISLLEPDGTLIEVNATALEFSGLTAGEIIGKKHWNRAWWSAKAGERDRVRALVEQAAQGEMVRFEAEVHNAQGEGVIVDFTIKPIRDRRGQVVQLISEGRNITELRHTLHHLHLAENRLEEAQRIAQIGHWDYDLARGQASWSKTLLEIMGLSRTQTITTEVLLDHIHPEDKEGLLEALGLSFRTGKPYEYYFRVVRPGGEIRMVFGAGGPVAGETSESRRMTGIVQDITGRRQLEESLAYSVERLSALNRMVQSVASSLDLEIIYRDMLSAGRALLKADAMILFLHEGTELFIAAVEQAGPLLDLLGRRLPENAGIAGEAWTSGNAVWLSGDECRRRRSDHLAKASGYDPASIIAVPIRWQDQVLGVLEATDAGEEAFSSDDVRLLQSMATWTAIAIGNARQHRSLERQLQESEAIAAVSRSLSETLEPQYILELIVHTAHDIVPRSDWAIMHLLQGRPERLVPTASAGVEDDLSDYIIGPDEGAAGLALTHGQPINISDTKSDPRPSSYAHMIGLRSLLVAPVQTRNRRLGTISLYCRQPGAFTEDDERLLTILASQAGLAIENAQLFDSQRRARLVAELQRERLKILTDRLVTAQEEERLRISRELHDEAGQALTSLKISLDLIQNTLLPDQAVLRSKLADLSALTGSTMENLRALAHDLRPPGLDAFGLNVALEGLCQDFAARTLLVVRYAGTELPDLPTAVALSLYRFAQEALTNIAKHAEARHVDVRLARENSALSLTIADDGRGFAYDAVAGQGGVGLVSMQERTDLLGGVLDIDTNPGEGTRVTARVPIDMAASGLKGNEERT